MALIFICFASLFAQASEVGTNHIPIHLDKVLRVSYQNEAWNRETTQIDSAQILLKDKTSNRLILVQLQETEPDSSHFFGYFSIGWQDQSEFVPLVYLPPKGAQSQSALRKLIDSGKIQRSPYVLFKGDNGEQILEVFDTKEQAEKAHEDYRVNNRAEKFGIVKLKPIPDESLLEAQRQAAIAAEKRRLEEEARRRELERQRLKAAEEERARLARQKAAKLAAAEKAKRRAKAKKIAEQAMQAYQAGDYPKAETLFKQSVDLDPENDSYYLQYGVTLYRNKKYNESLVYLRLASENSKTAESSYFMALNHLRLKEYPTALENFDDAIASQDPVIAPSSAFYKGIVYFATEEFEESRNSFQVVLDTSSDPRLDRQAEEYIEKIARINQFREQQKKPYSVKVLLAPMYDSNVLQVDASGGSLGPNTDKGSTRFLSSLDFGYRPIFTPKHELNIVANVLNITTSSRSVSSADPTILGVKLPYKHRGQLWGMGWQFGSQLSYSNLAIDGASFLDTTALTFDSTHIPSQSWAHVVKLALSSDTAKKVTQARSDATATKVALKYSASNFLNSDKTYAVTYDGGVTSNSAKGDNNKYTRIDLGIGFNMPAFWASSFTSKLSIYSSSYPSYSSDSGVTIITRTDTNTSLSVGLNKPFSDWLIGTSNLTYTTNGSNISSNKYDKYTLMIGAMMAPRF